MLFVFQRQQLAAQTGLLDLRAYHFLLRGKPVGITRLRDLFQTGHQLQRFARQPLAARQVVILRIDSI